MNIRIPRSGQAAKIAQQFLKTLGLKLTHSQSLELVARLHGYPNWQTLEADPRFTDAPALKPVSSHEYEMAPKERSAWIGIDNISVGVTRTDEGVTVDLYAKGHEDNSLAGTHLFFHEAEPDEDNESFEGGIVDWNRVADNEDIVGFSIDGNPERQVVRIDRDALRQLAHLKVLNSHLRLSRTAVFEYTIADANGKFGSVQLGRLVAAMEETPGVIRLLNNQTLRLLESGADGNWLTYSPSLNRTV